MAGVTAGHGLPAPPPEVRWGPWLAAALTAVVLAAAVLLGLHLAGDRSVGTDDTSGVAPAADVGPRNGDADVAPEVREDLPELLPRGDRDVLRERLDGARPQADGGPALAPEVRRHVTGLRPRALRPGADLRDRLDRAQGTDDRP